MTALLLIVSCAWILALFVSATIVAGWALIRLLDGFVRLRLSITEPETRAPKRATPDPNPHQWKRAGHW
jgi:hypothetical protein